MGTNCEAEYCAFNSIFILIAAEAIAEETFLLSFATLQKKVKLTIISTRISISNGDTW